MRPLRSLFPVGWCLSTVVVSQDVLSIYFWDKANFTGVGYQMHVTNAECREIPHAASTPSGIVNGSLKVRPVY